MQPAEEKTVKQIQSIHRALDIMELLIDQGDGMKLTEIANGTGLNKTTAFHIIKTLESRGYLEQSPDSLRYKSGWRQFVNGQQIYKGMNLNVLCADMMQELSERYDELVELYIYAKSEKGRYKGLCTEVIQSNRSVQISSHVGKLVPLSATAAGNIYLASLSPDDAADAYAAEKPTLDGDVVKTLDAVLMNNLNFIRKRGYILICGEYDEGVTAVSAGFYKYSGRAVGALQVSLPQQRATDDKVGAIVDGLLQISRKMSAYPL